jgi:hypothetical protein
LPGSPVNEPPPHLGAARGFFRSLWSISEM